MCSVDLGFAEDCDAWEVDSPQFPSKIGGKPAWLDLENLPTPEQLQCDVCQQPTIFLCQIYAPYEQDADNFHRTIFVFICRNAACCKLNSSNNFKVFRSSLRRDNLFYSFNPPCHSQISEFSVDKWATLCHLCGCSSDKRCGRCKQVSYCSKYHQVLDWKKGHKGECQAKVDLNRKSAILFPQLIIEIEPEEIQKTTVNETSELRKLKEMQDDGKAGTMPELSCDDLEMHAAVDQDKTFSKFKECTYHHPDQILRYNRGGQPLWIAKKPTPDEIPNCQYCGGSRQFEFQIMPQLLAILKENVLDWGVVAIYTCTNSCREGTNYKSEFVFKQDVTIKDTQL